MNSLAAAPPPASLGDLWSQVAGGFASFAGSPSGTGFWLALAVLLVGLVVFGGWYLRRPDRTGVLAALAATGLLGAALALLWAGEDGRGPAALPGALAAAWAGSAPALQAALGALAAGAAVLIGGALIGGGPRLCAGAMGLLLAVWAGFPAWFLGWRLAERIAQLEADLGRRNEFEFLHAPPGYALVLFVAAPIIVAVTLLYRGEQGRAPWRGRLLLAFVRVELLALVLFLLLAPVIAGVEFRQLRGAALVLIDDSFSMSVRTPEEHYGDTPEEQRLAALAETLAHTRHARLRARLAALLGAEHPALARYEEERERRAGWRARREQLARERRLLTAEADDAARRAALDRDLAEAQARLRRSVAQPAALDETALEAATRARAAALLAQLAELEGGISRLELTAELLRPELDRTALAAFAPGLSERAPLLEALAADNELWLFAFSAPTDAGGATLRRLTLDDLDFLRPRGHETHLSEAVLEAMQRVRAEDHERRIAELVVFSDGRPTGATAPLVEIRPRLDALQDPPPWMEAVALGNPRRPRDLELLALEAPQEIIKGEICEVTLTVKAAGFPAGERAAVLLTRDELAPRDPRKRIAYQDLDGVALDGQGADRGVDFALPDAGRIRKLTLRFQPEEPGTFTYFVKLGDAPKPGERTYDNNFQPFRLTVTDRKIRVLHVEYRPRYDYRHLQFAMQRDPNIEFRAFLVNADRYWPQPVSTWRTADSEYPEIERLKELPRVRPERAGEQPTFEDLFYYDVIILGDVPKTALPDGWLDDLKTAVAERECGLIVHAGPAAMPGDYAGTAIEGLLPVYTRDGPDPSEEARDTFRKHFLQLTPDGLSHPVMRMESDPALNRLVFEGEERQNALPPFYWFAPYERLKSGATVLARHRDLKGEKGAAFPLLCYQHYGRGLVFYVAFEGVWRWKKFRGDDPYFYPFWQRAVRFSTIERLSRRQEGFTLYTDKKEYELGEETRLFGRVSGELAREVEKREGDRTWLPVFVRAEGDPSASLRTGDGPAVELALTREHPAQIEAQGRFLPTAAGWYEAWIPGLAASEEHRHAFEVRIPIEEFRDPSMDRETLEQLAGDPRRVHTPDRLADVAIKADVQELPRRLPPRFWWKEEGRFHDVLVFGFLVVLLLFEWIGRKLMQLL